MKNKNFILRYFLLIVTALISLGCVHDNEYDDLNTDNYKCGEATATLTIEQVKAKISTNTEVYTFPAESTDILEGYVSSSDDTGNIYKYIYIQDSPDNPTAGFTLSVNSLSNYTRYPQGAKIYISLKGLSVGTYGNVKQLGAVVNGAFGRIPEKTVYNNFLRSCSPKAVIVPKVMTLAEMVSENDKYLGCLIEVKDAEFDSKVLCSNYAPAGNTVDRPINDPSTGTSRIVRNSGYASFANKTLPAGKGSFVGIFSKYNSTYQMYIVRDTDLKMDQFPRKDGLSKNPCGFDDAGLSLKSVAEVKQLYSGSVSQITQDIYIKVKVTANDETGNLYKYVYAEDQSGGIRINLNKLDLFLDPRFKVGASLIVKLKNLYVGASGGEIQIGQPYESGIGQIAENQIYNYFFPGTDPAAAPVAKELTIPQLSFADVGRWIKIKNVQFVADDLGEPYALGTTTNRTLKDCNGNQIILRTSNFATFKDKTVDAGQGDIYAILSYYNGTYQLWIPYQKNADLDNPRCDDAVAPTVLFNEVFGSSLNAENWTAVNVLGPQVWGTSNQGTGAGNYYAVMNGYSGGNVANEDWLVSKEISLSGYTNVTLTFDSDVRYNGTPIKVYATDNYSGNPTTTTWTELSAIIDTNSGVWGFVSSGNVSLNAFANKNIRIAFKYVSTTSAANTWEIDNVKVKGRR